MNVLFLLSSLEPAGSETYCVALEKAWTGKHRVFWISDQLHFGQTYQAMPISKKIFPTGLSNLLRVTRFVRENHIDIIHSHSRRANWVGNYVSKITGVPHVATIHQPLPVHFFSRIDPCLGDASIAVSENARDHILHRFGARADRVHLIRNGIAIVPPPSPRPPSARPRVLLLGRVSGNRRYAVEFFLDVLKRVAPRLRPADYEIIGQVAPELRAQIETRIASCREAIAPSRLELKEWTSTLSTLIDSADVVVGAGRSALESLMLEKPVIVLGERLMIGLCRPETWQRCQQTNFGDHHSTYALYPALLEQALHETLRSEEDLAALAKWGRAQVVKDYNLEKVAIDVDAVYRSLVD